MELFVVQNASRNVIDMSVSVDTYCFIKLIDQLFILDLLKQVIRTGHLLYTCTIQFVQIATLTYTLSHTCGSFGFCL